MSEQEQEVQAEVSSRNYEEEARAQGWRGEEDWKGDPEDFVDAKTFVKRGEAIMPILRRNNEKLLKELNEAKQAAEEARTVAREFQTFQKENFEKKAEEYKEQIKSLREQKKEAINEGDGERVVAIDEAIDVAKEQHEEANRKALEKKEIPKLDTTAIDPSLQTWLDSNTWFGQDRRLTGIANALGETIRTENPGLTGKAFLNKLDEELASIQNPRETPPHNPVEGRSTSRPTSSKKHSYEALPAEAKAACDRFVNQKLMTREQYVAEYAWE
jgi:hypothetical protein